MLIHGACPRTIPKHFQLKASKMLTAERRWRVGYLLLMASETTYVAGASK